MVLGYIPSGYIKEGKNGVSMLYLQGQLGIKSYRAAWMVGHKIRYAMIEREELYTLTGTVQTDEILIGGKGTSLSKNPKKTNKTPYLAMRYRIQAFTKLINYLRDFCTLSVIW